jgi:hypothetical protein
VTDLTLSDGERAIAEHFKSKYGLKWPFAAHLAKDAIGICELSVLKSAAAEGSVVGNCKVDECIQRGLRSESAELRAAVHDLLIQLHGVPIKHPQQAEQRASAQKLLDDFCERSGF